MDLVYHANCHRCATLLQRGVPLGWPSPPLHMTTTQQLAPQTYMELVDHADHSRRGILLQSGVPLGWPPTIAS